MILIAIIFIESDSKFEKSDEYRIEMIRSPDIPKPKRQIVQSRNQNNIVDYNVRYLYTT